MLTVTNEAIQGQRQSWNLIKKLGEGDAGEVYLVEVFIGEATRDLKTTSERLILQRHPPPGKPDQNRRQYLARTGKSWVPEPEVST